MLYCKYCGKECKNNNSLVQHQIRCKNNPDSIPSSFIKYNEDIKLGIKIKSYSNQYTKAECLGLEKPIVSEETRNKQKYWLGKNLSKETKEKLSNTICNKIDNDEWHTNRGISIEYNGIIFDSSWEIEFAKLLDNKAIKWERPKRSFEYIWNDSIHKYYPDFYLVDYDLYIEIKGIPTDRDYCKWRQFKFDLDIYDSQDLHNLIGVKIDNRNLILEEFRTKHLDIGSIVAMV